MAQNYSGNDGEPFLLKEVERPIIGALLGIISVCAFFGNVLVILSFALSKKLQNTTNVFVVNLSVADLITSVCITVNVVAIARPQHLPDWICVWCGFFSVICVGCSVYTLACIAAYRFNVISKRQRQLSKSAKAVVISVVVGLTWFTPITVATVPLLFGLGEFGYNTKYSSCTWNSYMKDTYDYSLILSACYYPVPMLVIITSYSKIFFILRKIKKRVSPELAVPSEPSSGLRIMRHAQRAPYALEKRQATVTKNMFYVVCAFLICMTPYSMALVFPGSDRFIPYSAVILMLSSCVNPTIYATKHPDFSKVMKKIVTCNFHKIPHYVFR
ncbi:allatostatin-A receptor-like [Patiria miniata]|uniref:G-protein coupled receptors family 1 profile domain-containing protein n=1 Tax=Patiria miniata TaxID=46514 RepID=A0A913ZXU2_PATMI|nr:allatostatin-A receptor-like [Patiria miniata]